MLGVTKGTCAIIFTEEKFEERVRDPKIPKPDQKLHECVRKYTAGSAAL
jgi:hypothetical protein